MKKRKNAGSTFPAEGPFPCPLQDFQAVQTEKFNQQKKSIHILRRNKKASQRTRKNPAKAGLDNTKHITIIEQEESRNYGLRYEKLDWLLAGLEQDLRSDRYFLR